MAWKKLLIIISLLLPLASPALAVNSVSVDKNLTLALPSDGSSYTLYSGGAFDSLTVSNETFSFVLGAGGKVEITSADKKRLTNTLELPTVCQADNSYLNITLSPGTGSTTVTVTPSGSPCSSGGGGVISSGGGGGGGGSGGGTFAVAPPAPIPAPAPAPLPLAVLPSPLIVSAFTRTLVVGSKGDDVRALQEYLAKDPTLYPYGRVTGYFGGLTKSAVQRFQKKYGIAAKDSPGYGVVGPKTRAKLNKLAGGAVTSPVENPASANMNATAILLQQIEQIQAQIDKLKNQ